MTYEQTIRGSLGCAGIGLHSGVKVNLRLRPASPGSGVIFRRSDLENFEVEATGRNVARVSYATSLMKKGVLISTTEHLLAALMGMGIDNAIVELDNLELPILDGSAQPFVEMVLGAGIRKQRRQRTYMRILRAVELREGNKFIAVYPAETYSVSYSINFPHPLIGAETYTAELTPEVFRREIAPARTFGSVQDERALRDMGLIRGVSQQNCIVLDRERVINGPLRYADEFVRHKMLDLIGDLALLGRRILGRVVADRAGHAMHTAMVAMLLRDRSLWEEATVDENAERTVASYQSPVVSETR